MTLPSRPTVPVAQAMGAATVPVLDGQALASLATRQAGTLAHWQAMAQDPALFPGWRSTSRRGDPLVRAAARLAVQEVAERLNAPVDWAVRSALPGMDEPFSALAAVLFTVPKEKPGFPFMETPWSSAQRASQELIVAMLLAAGTPIDDQAWAFSAPANGSFGGRATVNPRLLDRLLATGQRIPAVLTTADDEGTTLLHRMARVPSLWSPATVEAVIRQGVDVNARTGSGRTALHLAVNALTLVPEARSLDPSMAFLRTLLEHGTDPSIPDHRGMPVLHTAVAQDRAEAMVLLVAHGASPDSVWCRPPFDGGSDEEHEPGQPDPDAMRVHAGTRFNGWLPVHTAAAHATTVATLNQLLAWGASADVPDLVHGNTPLHLAVFHHNPWAVERLLDAGVSPDLKNRAGQTAHDLLVLDDPARSVNDAPDPAAIDAIRTMLERWDLHQALRDGPTTPPVERPRARL